MGVGITPTPESDASEAASAGFALYVAKKDGPASRHEGGYRAVQMMLGVIAEHEESVRKDENK